jgi:hypothetical protein
MERGNPATFASNPPGFQGGALRSVYAGIFVLFLGMAIMWMAEAVWRIFSRRKAEIPKAGSEMGTGIQGKPTLLDRLMSSRAILWNGLLALFGAVVFLGTGSGVSQTSGALLWVAFCLIVTWAIFKLFLDSGYVDLIFVVATVGFLIAAFSLSFT